MAIELPASPGPREFDMDLVSASNALRPGNRPGPVQKINRTGSHWVASIVMPPMTVPTARGWLARLRAEAETVVFPIVQPGLDITGWGAPRVKGASQLGNALRVDGMTPGKAGMEGQFLSVVVDGRRFAYEIRADFVVPVGGEVLIPIQPLIRKSPADDAVVELAEPKIEGFPGLPSGAGKITVDRLVAGLNFTIEERE